MSTIYTVVTYGNGQVVAEIMNAVATIVGEHAYTSILRLAGLLAFCWMIANLAVKGDIMRFASWFFSMYLLFNLLIVPKITVSVEDRLDMDRAIAVDNVPAGLAVFASMVSRVGDSVTQLFDMAFSLPDDLRYSKTGYLMAAHLAQTIGTMTITDPNFSSNLNNFVKQCVFYDILLGKYSLDDLYQTEDIWSFVSKNASPARAFAYVKETKPQILTCKDGISKLNHAWSKEINQSATLLGQHLFGPKVQKPKSLFLSRLPLTLGYLTHLSQLTGKKLMKQAMMSTMVRNAVDNYGAETGSSAAVARFANTRGDELQRSKFEIVGSEAANWLAIMGNVINALLYGGFLLIAPLCLLPSGWNTIKYYIQVLCWVQCWPPLFAILNLAMTFGLQVKSTAAVATATGGVINLNTYGGLAAVNADMATFAGYATIFIPMIAWGFVSAGKLTVTALASNFASVATQAAARSSEEATTGNYGFENVSLDNQSAFNTSDNHFSTNAVYQGGMSSLQQSDGAMLHHTADGETIIDSRSAISSLGTSINYADAIRSSASTHSEQALTAGLNDSHQYGEQLSGVLRNMYELGDSLGHSFTQDSSASTSQSAQFAKSMENYKQDIDEFATTHGLTTGQAVKVLGQVYAGGEISAESPKFLGMMKAKADAGVKGSLEGMSDAQRSQIVNDAERFTQTHSIRDSVDEVHRASLDDQVRSSSENGSRLMDNIGTSYEHALSSRHDAVANLQQASSYRDAASFAEEHAASVNVNMGQQFADWVAEQPGASGSPMGYGEAEKLINQHPDVAQSLANTFIAQEAGKLAEQYGSVAETASGIEETYQAQSAHLEKGGSIQQAQQLMKQTVAEKASQSGITESSHASSSVVEHVQSQFNEANDDLTSEQLNDEAKGYLTKRYDKMVTDPNQHDLGHRAIQGAKKSIKSTLEDIEDLF